MNSRINYFLFQVQQGGFLLSLGIINSRVTGFSIKDLVEFIIIIPGACTASIMKVKLGNFT